MYDTEAIAPDEIMNIKAYEYYRLTKDFPVHQRQTHIRRCPNLIQVREGELRLWLNCQKYTLHTGDMVYIAENTLASYEWSDAELDVLVLNPDLFQKLPAVQTILTSPRYTFGCFLDDRNELIASLHNIMANAILSSRYVEHCGNDIRQALLAFIDGKYTYIQPETEPFSARQLAHLRTVIELMERSLPQQMTLEELSDSVRLSQKYFCRFFQRMTGQSPFTFINSKRIERACIIFINEKVTVQEVALRVGYKDVNYFIKTFKRCCGITPKRFSMLYFGSTAYPWK